MQPRFPVQILPRKRRFCCTGRVSFSCVRFPIPDSPLPRQYCPAVRHLLRRAVYVRMVIQHLIRFARAPCPPRQRLVAPGRCRYTGCCFFPACTPAPAAFRPIKTSSGYTAFLPRPARASPPACPARRTRTRNAVRCSPDDRHFRQPVLRVPAIVLRTVAAPLFHHPAIFIVTVMQPTV